MGRQVFQIETLQQAVIMLGEPSDLTRALTTALHERGIYAILVQNSAELAKLQTTHDPDYIVVFLSQEFSAWLHGEGSGVVSTLAPLIKSGQSRLVMLTRDAELLKDISLGIPTKSLVISNYLSKDKLVCPLIDSWLNEIQQTRSLTIQGDGLTEISILSLKDLIGLITAAVLDSRTSNQTTHLEALTTVSELNLAYLLRTSLPFKVELVFAPSQKRGENSQDRSSLAALYRKLGYIPSNSPPIEELQEYFRTNVKRPQIKRDTRISLPQEELKIE